MIAWRGLAAIMFAGACASRGAVEDAAERRLTADTISMSALARDLSADSMRGRGPFTPENERAARRLADELRRIGARPLFGDGLLVPFTTDARPDDTVFNVVGVIPARDGTVEGELIGITAHFDHLGIGRPDSTGDSIYNGFLDAALPNAMVLDIASRYARAPEDRPLAVFLFNLEEQGLLGSRALVMRADADAVIPRLRLIIGVDAGSPAGEAMQWQLMGGTPSHTGAVIADSLARLRGWTTTATPPRPISDVFVFSQRGVPILFPIPGAEWRGYTEEERARAMREFDHYHQPADEWRDDFPLTGTAVFADWLFGIVMETTRAGK